MITRRVSLALLICGLLGCVQPVRPFAPTVVGTEHVFQRNYELGKTQSVYVGEPVVKFKDYFVRRRQGRTMRPSVDFRVENFKAISARTDEEFPVTGSLTVDGVDYVLIVPKSNATLSILVDASGKPYRKFLDNATRAWIVKTPHFEPSDVRFLSEPGAETVDASAGFKNFELVYGGTDGKSFTLTYREYSPEDLIRPAFTQNLTYPVGSTAVRYRGTRLTVQEVTSEKITYTVLADESEAKK